MLQIPIQNFNIISLLVLVTILVTGLTLIHLAERKEMKRLKNMYPSTGKKRRKYPMVVDAKLSIGLDEHEKALS